MYLSENIFYNFYCNCFGFSFLWIFLIFFFLIQNINNFKKNTIKIILTWCCIVFTQIYFFHFIIIIFNFYLFYFLFNFFFFFTFFSCISFFLFFRTDYLFLPISFKISSNFLEFFVHDSFFKRYYRFWCFNFDSSKVFN